MFIQKWEKPIQLKAMGEEKGVVEFSYNELFKTLKTKIYFKDKKVYSNKKKIDNKKNFDFLEGIRNKNIFYFKELSLSSFSCVVVAYDEKGKQIGNALKNHSLDSFVFNDFLGARKKIEKIIVYEKLKNA